MKKIPTLVKVCLWVALGWILLVVGLSPFPDISAQFGLLLEIFVLYGGPVVLAVVVLAVIYLKQKRNQSKQTILKDSDGPRP